MNRIVLAYSGGLRTSIAIPWLAEKYHAEIVTLTMDLGQGRDLEDIRQRALAIGAARAHVLDLREEFAREFIVPAMQAGAMYDGRYPLATALGRPLIAKHLVKIARIENTKLIAHGSAPIGNDAVRLEMSARAFEPAATIISPAREWAMNKAEQIEFAREHGIPVPPSVESPYTVDRNLWGRSIEYGVVEDPWLEPPEDIYLLTKRPADASDTPAYVEVEFHKGVPAKINGVGLGLVELIQSVETIAGMHGVGRIDMVENQLTGIKSREVYEAPAAVLLHTARKEMQEFVTSRDLERLTTDLGSKYADLVYNGSWYTPTREAIDALVAKVQQTVTGTIRLKLFKGDCRVVGRRAGVEK